MVRKRPATISSSSPGERGRFESRSPPSDSNSSNHIGNKNHPPKARARTASSNLALEDGLLPLVVPVQKLFLPGDMQRQQQRRSSDQRAPFQKKWPLAVMTPAGAPRAAHRPLNNAAEHKAAARANRRAGNANLVAKANPTAMTATPRRPSNVAVSKPSRIPDMRRPNSYDRRPAAPHSSDRRSPDQDARTRRANTAGEVARQNPEEEEDDEELTPEEVLLLCGVQPGSAKALWFTSMHAQLDTRASGNASLMSEVGKPYSSPKLVQMLDSACAVSAAPPSSRTPLSTPPATCNPAASLLSIPLQIPVELLSQDENASFSHASVSASTLPVPPPLSPPVTAPAMPPAVASAAQLPHAPSRRPPSFSPPGEHAGRSSRTETMSEDDGEKEPAPHEASSTSSEHSDEDEGEEAEEEEETSEEKEEEKSTGMDGSDEESSEESYSPSPTKFGKHTCKPASKAADLSHLRPSRRQLQEQRVRVLSLHQQKKREEEKGYGVV